MPFKQWGVGEELLAPDFQSYVQNQAVVQFPNVAARDTWASPPVGAVCITTDYNAVWLRATVTQWIPFPGSQYAYVENTSDVAWASLEPTLVQTANPITFYGGTRYAIAVDIAWTGSVLGDSHLFTLQKGIGPGGDFSSVVNLRQWQIANARGTVTGHTEHFHAVVMNNNGGTAANGTISRLRVTAKKASGTGGGNASPSSIEVVSRGIAGTA